MIDLSEVFYSYKKNTLTLKNITKSFNQGKIYGIVGPNGAGKTTLLNLMSGVHTPRTGKIAVDSYDIVKNREESIKRVGIMPDGSYLDPDEKIITQMVHFAFYYGIGPNEARARSLSLLAKMGLPEEYSRKTMRNLSLGQRRRVSLAVALLHDPENILMDEPYNGFDPFGIKMVTDIMLEAKNAGKTVIVSSHILKELQTISDEFNYIEDGQLLKSVDIETMSRNVGKIWVKVLNPDDELMKLLQTFGVVRRINQAFEITTPTDAKVETSDINSALVKENYKVDSIYYEKRTVEDEFFTK
ncbi:MAG: ABC transporter ATP-binding protein [Candidatus Thermoplasmatota archaeon]|nr:ABC transporter ATP-binding protein [Candidatus Thermoplasmatota archaeon]